jgi:uncharacterized protein with PIN domain
MLGDIAKLLTLLFVEKKCGNTNPKECRFCPSCNGELLNLAKTLKPSGRCHLHRRRKFVFAGVIKFRRI